METDVVTKFSLSIHKISFDVKFQGIYCIILHPTTPSLPAHLPQPVWLAHVYLKLFL